MSSQRKSDTARANGAKSHGPKTAEGKKKSSLNALTHGHTSKTVNVVLANESDNRFKAVLDSYVEHFEPDGPIEKDLVEEMAVAKWRQRRLWSIETAELDRQMDLLEEQLDDATNTAVAFGKLADESNILALVHRYETRMSRTYDRALKTLLKLQEIRLGPPAFRPQDITVTWVEPGKPDVVSVGTPPPGWRGRRHLSMTIGPKPAVP